MVEQKDGSLVASMAFVEILDYAKKSVAEQINLTARFNALLAEALQRVAPAERIVLDSGNGAAVAFLGKTEDALLAAMDLRDRIGAGAADGGPALLARIGINVGPVKLVKDDNEQPNVVGDGITVAHSVMGFAAPGQILVSDAYCEAVSRLSREYEKLFESDGSRTDRYLREHHVYAVGKTPAGLRAQEPGNAAAAASDRNRKMRLGAVGAVVAILVIAIGVRTFRTKPLPPPEPAPPPATAATEPVSSPAAVTAPAVEAPATTPPTETKAPKKKAVKPKTDVAAAPAVPAPVSPAPAPPPPPGSVHFAIAPWGEVYIDGAKRGVSPPLTEVQVAPGKHNIEVRNTSFPSYTTTIEVTSGAQSKIKYKFN